MTFSSQKPSNVLLALQFSAPSQPASCPDGFPAVSTTEVVHAGARDGVLWLSSPTAIGIFQKSAFLQIKPGSKFQGVEQGTK